MKIIHTESSCGWGGQEIRILSEARGMIERGHTVTLVCPPTSGIFRAAATYGVPTVALPIYKKRLTDFLALRRWLRDNDPIDVINTHSSTDSWLTALACATLAGAPPIVRTRHVSAPISTNWPTRWLYGRASAHVVTTGETLRHAVLAVTGLPEERVTSVPTGIDTDRYTPGDRTTARAALDLDQTTPIVGIVATLRSWKGHRYLIEALASLPLRINLLIVGDGPQRAALASQVAELGLTDRVRFTGNREDVPLWLQAFDVFVLPSYANEGVPQALMQAMAVGLPCVTTSVGAIGELAQDGETALVVPAKNAAAIAAALQRLLGEAELRQRLGAAARTRVVAGFARSLMVERMEKLFYAVVKGAACN
ncbi:MAG: glycosyltransferase family 4 protein [Rhodocyclaceae bacterium]|nr:glycosyltransferase family 4 protein [Rhodocyclaceae bacterium]